MEKEYQKRNPLIPEDIQYHSLISIHLNWNGIRDNIENIEHRILITRKIKSYLYKFLCKNGSKKYKFPIVFVYEKRFTRRFHLHFTIPRLDPNTYIHNKLIKEHLKINEDKILDYDHMDKAIEFIIRRIKINGMPIVMNGKKSFHITRKTPKETVDYLSKYENKITYEDIRVEPHFITEGNRYD
jgi:hypothetical protein